MKRICSNIFLVCVMLLIGFLLVELYYRLLDPYPYINPRKINDTEHGNLTQYDPQLGWKGIPDAGAECITVNGKTWIKHNHLGFRDIEHAEDTRPEKTRPEKNKPEKNKKDAIVFLGDSFTWGWEVNFEDMFVNKLRDRFSGFEIYNLSHRGYGTDQELLTFKRWRHKGPVKYVVLMFCENDFENNNSSFQYEKYKPVYKIIDNALVLTGTPVPRADDWQAPDKPERRSASLGEKIKGVILESHFLNDLRLRFYLLGQDDDEVSTLNLQHELIKQDTITRSLLQVLDADVAQRGAKLVVVAIPSKVQFMKRVPYIPYQPVLKNTCDALNIPFFDLAPAFQKTFFRTYYRLDNHWNKKGHAVAAEALGDFLAQRP